MSLNQSYTGTLNQSKVEIPLLGGTGTSELDAAATEFATLCGADQLLNNVEHDHNGIITKAGIIKNLYVELENAPLGMAAPTLFELFGAAMPSGAVYQFAGPSFSSQDDLLLTTSSGGSGATPQVSTVYHVPPGQLKLKSGNRFQARAQMIEDDVGTIFAIIGIGYI